MQVASRLKFLLQHMLPKIIPAQVLQDLRSMRFLITCHIIKSHTVFKNSTEIR